MKDAASTAQREQNQRQGLIVGTITLPFRLLGVLIGSLLFSIVVECVGMHAGAPRLLCGRRRRVAPMDPSETNTEGGANAAAPVSANRPRYGPPCGFGCAPRRPALLAGGPRPPRPPRH